MNWDKKKLQEVGGGEEQQGKCVCVCASLWLGHERAVSGIDIAVICCPSQADLDQCPEDPAWALTRSEVDSCSFYHCPSY